MQPLALGIIDWLLLGVLAVSVLAGLWRGLVFEVLSLLGWIAAYIAAQWFSPAFAVHVPFGTPGSALNHASAFAITFIGALVLWGIAARLIRMLVGASPLSLFDRVLGAGFGLLRGLVLLLAVATAVGMTPAGRSEAWRGSQGVAWLNVMLQGLKPVLPAQFARHLPA
ncbi:MAG TPA: CvpA family protein [Burkholderiaceae bacterium]|nr:CvpA family protein [Burkholderiaceae bacterium]